MTYNTRIQLKSDTEANWNALAPTNNSAGFIPLAGELIIYTADNTHTYCRLKIGDGSTNVTLLPFIDAGTLNGEEVEIVKVATYTDLPAIGSEDKLYVTLDTSRIYHYNGSTYALLSNFSYSITKKSMSRITLWHPGIITEASISNHTLKIKNGTLPELVFSNEEVVGNVVKE